MLKTIKFFLFPSYLLSIMHYGNHYSKSNEFIFFKFISHYRYIAFIAFSVIFFVLQIKINVIRNTNMMRWHENSQIQTCKNVVGVVSKLFSHFFCSYINYLHSFKMAFSSIRVRTCILCIYKIHRSLGKVEFLLRSC